MNLIVQFGNPRNISPGDLDGIIIRFPFTITYTGKGARKDEVKQYRIDVGISGTLYSMWGFEHLFESEQPINVIKTLFQFAKDEIENKLQSGTLSEHEEIMLSTSEFKENPYDVKKIKYSSESSFVVTIQGNDTVVEKSVNLKNPMVPNVFISYSWDNDTHRGWVRKLAEALRADGVNVTLDQWHLAPGDQMTEFMERAVRENDLVLIICTTRFKQKSDTRTGGVGYEGDIMTAEVLSNNNHRKFIPILREKPWKEVAPSWLLGKLYIDLSGDPYSEDQYKDLVATVHNQRPSPPPVGSPPASTTTLKSSYKQDKSITLINQPTNSN
ncbi:MAG: toll/interleukin-1 receptor domain-containing protein [Balneolaceae bacterium]|nr:toll/interleukin-1 receptor domain-containing protein [Balneolaceae bacterium]